MRGAVARRAALALLAAPAARAGDEVRLFRAAGPEGRITFGLTLAELEALGEGPQAARIARRLEEEAPFTAWLYALVRMPAGGMRYVAAGRAALPRGAAVEPFVPAVPTLPPGPQ